MHLYVSSSAVWLPPCFPLDRDQKLVCFSFCLQGMSVWGPGESNDLDSDGNADLLRISLMRSGDPLVPPGLASPSSWGRLDGLLFPLL